MSQIPDYDRDYREGLLAAVTWLAERSARMHDPCEKLVLDSAAANLARDVFGGKIPSKDRARPATVTTEEG